MSNIQISPEKLAEFESLVLHHGAHNDFESGHCAMEVVAWLADEGHTDAPECASPVLTRYTIRLNDRWDAEKRQQLKPYLLRMIGTGGDGKDEIRVRIAREYVAKKLLPEWLRLAGMDDQIALLEAASDTGDWKQLRSACWAFREAAYSKRRAVIKDAVEAELAKRALPKAAVAAAAADAAADADAFKPYTDAWYELRSKVYRASYEAARKRFDDPESPIRKLADKQAPAALELLDLLIKAQEI